MATGDLLAKLRTAIKEPHASIHKLNLSRIPLCLPPHTDGPDLYALGLSRYAELFYGIEHAWISLVGDPLEWISQDADADAEVSSLEEDSTGISAPVNEDTRIQTILRMLYLPELLRTRALEDDLRFLRALSPGDPSSVIESVDGGDYGRRVGLEIHQRIQDSPHILVAYVWIMYSALLYGGRDIRALLLKAGPDFWGLSAAEISFHRRIPCPLTFWHIDDEGDVKGRFRARMTDVELCLSAREQQDILDEAGRVFGTLEMLTRNLDEDAKLLNAHV